VDLAADSVFLLGEVDDPHAAPADGCENAIRTDLEWRKRGIVLGRRTVRTTGGFEGNLEEAHRTGPAVVIQQLDPT